MKFYALTKLAGIRKRTPAGTFTEQATAIAVMAALPPEVAVELEEIEVFEGTYEQYVAFQAELAAKQAEAEVLAAKAAARAKLTPAEIRLLNL